MPRQYGITDEVRGKLASLQRLQVTARASAAQYENVTNKSPQQIGAELAVDYLLTGAVRWEKGQGQNRRVRVRPELVEWPAARGQQPFDTELSDVFQMQAEIASRRRWTLRLAPAPRNTSRSGRRPMWPRTTHS